MIHPFSHLNAASAAGRFNAESGGTTASRRRDFAAMLESKAQINAPAAQVAVERRAVSAPAQDAVAPEPARGRETKPPETFPGSAEPAPSDFEQPGRRIGPPSFDEVPPSAQWPSGPYRQAPPEYGGQWWLVNPFTGPEPWAHPSRGSASAVEEVDAAPPGFRDVFGAKPSASKNGGAALSDWLRNLEHFKGVGIPDGFSEADVELAGAVYQAWGLSQPTFYNGRYGWRAAFVDNNGERFEASAFTSLAAPHLIIARRQITQITEGQRPTTIHPFVPPGVKGPDTEASSA